MNNFKTELALLIELSIKNGETVNNLEKIFNCEIKKFKKKKPKKKDICRSVLFISDSSDDE